MNDGEKPAESRPPASRSPGWLGRVLIESALIVFSILLAMASSRPEKSLLSAAKPGRLSYDAALKTLASLPQ